MSRSWSSCNPYFIWCKFLVVWLFGRRHSCPDYIPCEGSDNLYAAIDWGFNSWDKTGYGPFKMTECLTLDLSWLSRWEVWGPDVHNLGWVDFIPWNRGEICANLKQIKKLLFVQLPPTKIRLWHKTTNLTPFSRRLIFHAFPGTAEAKIIGFFTKMPPESDDITKMPPS